MLVEDAGKLDGGAADKEGSIRPEILDSILDPRDLTRVY